MTSTFPELSNGIYDMPMYTEVHCKAWKWLWLWMKTVRLCKCVLGGKARKNWDMSSSTSIGNTWLVCWCQDCSICSSIPDTVNHMTCKHGKSLRILVQVILKTMENNRKLRIPIQHAQGTTGNYMNADMQYHFNLQCPVVYVFFCSSLVDILLLHKQRQWLSEWWGMLIISCHVDINLCNCSRNHCPVHISNIQHFSGNQPQRPKSRTLCNFVLQFPVFKYGYSPTQWFFDYYY